MKKITFILIVLISLSTCNRPLKLLEKGRTKTALKVSLKRLKSGKVKDDHLYVLEKSFMLETERDAQRVASLRQKGEPAVWVEIHEIAANMVKRQGKVNTVQNRLNNKGYFLDMKFYPAPELLEESKENVAIYYYAKAQEFIPAAERGDRIAARKAFKWLKKSQEYKPNFRDTESLSNQMYAIGTTHVLLNPVNSADYYADRLFSHFFDCQTFPERKNWEVFHLNPPINEELDYQINLNWDRIYVSWDNVNKYSCSNTVSVKDGYEEYEVWSKKDSTYVTKRRPVYIDVSVTVNTFNQNKHAQLNLYCDVIDLDNQQRVNSFSFNQVERWANEYSEVCGDTRALSVSCRDTGGSRAFFPSDWDLLRNASYDLSRRFDSVIDDEVE